jgi:exoribonuclease R
VGLYALKRAGADVPGHFGLAVSEYTHSTAPNRRFPDLITHRLLKAALVGAKLPYTVDELDGLARHWGGARIRRADEGDQVRVELLHTDAIRGFIDFAHSR